MEPPLFVLKTSKKYARKGNMSNPLIFLR